MMKFQLPLLRRGLLLWREDQNSLREESGVSGILFPNGIKCLLAAAGCGEKI